MPRHYYLSPTSIEQLRQHKKWSLEHFGRAVTKKYFQDLDKGFQYIADNHRQLQTRSELTGDVSLGIYPVREHYVVYTVLRKGVYIAAVLGQAQDITNILQQHAAILQRELDQFSQKK